MERFNLKKPNDVEVKEQCQVKISKKSVALENLGGGGDDVGINRTWESRSIKENVKTSATKSLGYYELKQHKPWFHEE